MAIFLKKIKISTFVFCKLLILLSRRTWQSTHDCQSALVALFTCCQNLVLDQWQGKKNWVDNQFGRNISKLEPN